MIQSIERAISILNLFNKNKTMGVSEIAKSLELNKKTAFGIIETLEYYGYLEQDQETRKYSLGISLMELGTRYSERLDIRKIAMEYMPRLQEQTGESVQLAIYHKGHVVYIARASTPNYIQIVSREGKVTPAHSTATGKVLLAYKSVEELEEFFEHNELIRCTPNTITTREGLMEELLKIRKQGYSVDNEEDESGLQGIAMPIFDRRGRVVAALSIGFMSKTFNQEMIESYLPQISETIKMISYRLGVKG